MNLQQDLLGDDSRPIVFEPSTDNGRIANMLQLLILRDTSYNLDTYSYLGKKQVEWAKLKREYGLLDSKARELQSQCDSVTQELLELRENPIVDTNQVQNLTRELQENYKTLGITSSRLLASLDKQKELEVELSSLKTEKASMQSQFDAILVKYNDSQLLVKEKDNVIQILRDELTAHQLELSFKETRLVDLETKNNELTLENKNLLERWMLQKQKEASQMNDANDLITSTLNKMKLWARRSAPASTSSILQEETSPVIELKPPSTLPTRPIRKFTCHESDITCISISSDGKLLATGANDKNVVIYDAKTGAIRGTLTGALQAIMSVAIHVASDSILGSSNDNSIKIWSLSTNRLKMSLTGHSGKVYSAKFTENNKIVSGSHDRTIRVWDSIKQYCIRTMFTLSSCNDLIPMDSEGTVIVSGHLDNNLRVWDARTGNAIQELTGIHAGQITGLEVFPTSNQVLTTSRDNTLKLIDLRQYSTVCTYTHDSFKVGMNYAKSTVSHDATFIASGSTDGQIYIWNSVTQQVETTLKEHSSAICGVVWSPMGGASLYSADKDKNIVYWGI